MLYLNRLRLLLELQRCGTITAVAQALSYSPSTISQQLATLERETGVRLLEPVGRRVRLTPQAELLAHHAVGLLEQVERTEAALDGAHDEIVGTLRIAAFQTAVLTLVHRPSLGSPSGTRGSASMSPSSNPRSRCQDCSPAPSTW
jgi:DNA-binding transcriptional LysR family regulator